MELRRPTLCTYSGRKKVVRKPIKFVANVPVTSNADGNQKIIGTARVEQLSRDNFVYHINASGMTAEDLRRGLSFGAFEVPEETVVVLEKGLDR